MDVYLKLTFERIVKIPGSITTGAKLAKKAQKPKHFR